MRTQTPRSQMLAFLVFAGLFFIGFLFSIVGGQVAFALLFLVFALGNAAMAYRAKQLT